VASWNPADVVNQVLEEAEEPHAQCMDIVKDLDGNPLSVEYFADKLGVQADSFTCSDSFHGLMSNACRIHLHPGGQTAFYKRIIFKDIPHAKEKLRKAPYKLVTDSKSYEVVINFLTSQACQDVCEQAGVHIPRCLDAQLQPCQENPIDSKFSFLLEDLSPADGWSQRWLLQDTNECKASLRTLAKIHAFFWNGASFWKDTQAAQELEDSVWQSASYVQPNRNPNQCQNVAKKWATERYKCHDELSSFDFWDNLGERLQIVAEQCGSEAHPFAPEEDPTLAAEYQKYRTFTHGDPKQANLLFRHLPGGELEVGLIDYQWAGFGLAASDIAHFFTSAVYADVMVDGGEEKLLRYYFDELQTYLVEYGAFRSAEDAIKNFSWETFLEQYETGVLDMCRLVIAYTWARWDPVEKDDVVGCNRTMNKNSYSKAIPNVVWLMSKCDEILKSRGL